MRYSSKKTQHLYLASTLLLITALACSFGATAPTQVAVVTNPPGPAATAGQAQPTGLPGPTNTPKPTPIPPTPTPLPTGANRSNPYPYADVVSIPGWDIQFVEAIRGEEAKAVMEAKFQPEPLIEGMEYLLLKLHVKSTLAEGDLPFLRFQVTGDRLLRSFSGGDGVSPPDPNLYLEAFGKTEYEGWLAFMIGQGEGSLILIAQEEGGNFGIRWTFIALDKGASISVDPALANVEPTNLGAERNSPAPLTQTVITDDWEVTVLEVVHGDEAIKLIQASPVQSGAPLEEDKDYILAKVRVRYISLSEEFNGSSITASLYFKTTGSGGVLYDYPAPAPYPPTPALDEIWFFPGGEYEGWIVGQVMKGESGAILVFAPLVDSKKNTRFLSLEP